MPFFGAWQEVLTRWVGLGIENPVFAARAVQVWGAPNKVPGMVVTDPTTGEQAIQFRIPGIFKSIIGHGPLAGALDSQGTIRFAKGSINMLASGTPGFGPFVNLGISEIAKQRPEVGDALKSLLPYGVSDNALDVFLPSVARRGISLLRSDDDASYASTYHQVLITKLTQVMDNESGDWTADDVDKPEFRKWLFDSTSEETHKLYSIRVAASLLSPVALQFDSIYKPYINAYRELRQQNPDTADQVFMDRYGEELIYLTQAVTHTNNGVPPTLHGSTQYAKFQPLIDQYPEYGSIIVGPDAGGESSKFLSQVYNKQLNAPLQPGSDVKQRERLSPLETVTTPEVRLGWQIFSRYMDKIDAYMIQNGFTTYGQAENMRQFKNGLVSYLAQKYPAWGDEYFVRDERKWDKRIQAFEAMVDTPGLSDRPDMVGLSTYLKARKMVYNALQERDAAGGSASLFAQGNADIYQAWSGLRMGLKDTNLQFADLYNRYLDRDPLTIDPIYGSSE